MTRRRIEIFADSVQMLIHDLSRQVGVPASTIRYYERLGLLDAPPRSRAQYRLYGEPDVERLQFIQNAKRLGLSLTEIGQLITLRSGGTPPCQELKAMVAKHLRQLDQQIAQLQALRRELAIQEAELEAKLPKTAEPPPDSLCNGIVCGFVERYTDDTEHE